MFRLSIDSFVGLFLKLVGALTCLLLFLIFLFLLQQAWPALASPGLRVFSDEHWLPTEHASDGQFGIWPMLTGSLAVTAGALLLAVPAGVASALFCEYYAPPTVGNLYRSLVQLLAGIPSVVFGFWGLVTLAPIIARWHPPGPGLLCGILIVGLMIVPTVMLVSGQALAAVPEKYVRAAAANGIGRLTFLTHVALPSARHGLITAAVLGAARAVGETMAVVMVCGNIVKVPQGILDPVRTLTANIAMEMGYALGDHRSTLFLSGLVLMVVVVFLVVLVQFFVTRNTFNAEGGS